MATEKPGSTARLLSSNSVCVLHSRKCSAKQCLLEDALHVARSGTMIWVMSAVLKAQYQFVC